MSLELGNATVISEIERIRMVGSAFHKTGRPVAFVPLTTGVHAGHIALVRAAKHIRGAVTVVALQSPHTEELELLRAEGVDIVWDYSPETLWPHGRRIAVSPVDAATALEPDLSEDLSLYLALILTLSPTDVLLGEKDYELLLAIHHAVQDFHLGVRVQGVPAVRMPDGVVMSLRNTNVPAESRDQAAALSAALTAGAHAAEAGAGKVREVAAEVLRAAGVEPDYLEVRGRDLGTLPRRVMPACSSPRQSVASASSIMWACRWESALIILKSTKPRPSSSASNNARYSARRVPLPSSHRRTND